MQYFLHFPVHGQDPADHTYSRPVIAAYRKSSPGGSIATPPPTSCTTPTPTPVLRVSKYKTLLKRERLRTFRLKRQVHHLKNAPKQKNLSPESLIQGAANFLEEPALSFFAAQLRNSTRHCRQKGRRWTYSDKVMALSLYHQGPRAYKFCQSVFALPSVPSLRRWLSGIEIRPGFSATVFDMLASRVAEMTPRDRLCIVTFDEMSLRSSLTYNISTDSIEGVEDFGSKGKTARIANHALVFMARGLTARWKQPVGYFLSKDATPAHILLALLSECLNKIRAIGLNTTAVVCDQGTNNVALYKQLGISPITPFFMHSGVKVFALHDPPHLLKNTRSNLEKYNFKISTEHSSKTIKWSYLQKFFEFDSQLPIRKAPKLTKGHFQLNSFSKMRVNKAAQVLSHTVAAGLYTYVALGKLPGEAVHTAEFVELIDSLFDSFNSRFYKDKKALKRPLTEKSTHAAFLKSCLPILQNLDVIGSKNVMFTKGWLLAIACLTQLWDHLKSEHNLSLPLHVSSKSRRSGKPFCHCETERWL